MIFHVHVGTDLSSFDAPCQRGEDHLPTLRPIPVRTVPASGGDEKLITSGEDSTRINALDLAQHGGEVEGDNWASALSVNSRFGTNWTASDTELRAKVAGVMHLVLGSSYYQLV